MRAVGACAFRRPGTGEASAEDLPPEPHWWEAQAGAGVRGGSCVPSSLHLPSDHDRYVGACQVQPLCAAPPGLGGRGPPGCPPASTVSGRAAVSAPAQPARRASRCPPRTRRISVCVLSPHPARGLTGFPLETTSPGTLVCASAPPKVKAGSRVPTASALPCQTCGGRCADSSRAPGVSVPPGALVAVFQLGTDWDPPSVGLSMGKP